MFEKLRKPKPEEKNNFNYYYFIYNKTIDDCEKILAEKVEEVKQEICNHYKEEMSLNCHICKRIDKIFKSEAKQ